MNKYRRLALITTFSICLLPEFGLAQERPWYLGLSAGVTQADFVWPMALYAGYSPQVYVTPSSPRTTGTLLRESTDDPAPSFEALVGYRLNANFFVEAAWKRFDEFGGEALVREDTTFPFSPSLQSTAERATRVSMNVEGGTLALGGSFPLSQRFSMFALAGGLHARLETVESFVIAITNESNATGIDEEGWTWFAGFGAEYSATDRLHVRLAYRHYGDVGTQINGMRYYANIESGGIDLRDASLGLLFTF